MKNNVLMLKLKRSLSIGFPFVHRIGYRTLLSQAYRCEDAWAKRLESPLLSNLKMDKYFMEIDKKFGTKDLASGIDIDLFAINVEDVDKLDELEHLLYRFRRTKRACEMMDSTICAVVRVFLKFKEYEALFRILRNVESYGIFPDAFLYNILLDSFIEEKMFKEAAQVSVLMMLQEDFSNEINRFFAVYSCHMFLKNNSLDTLYDEPKEVEKKADDDEEEEVVRVPFFRNPWFDDHFDLTEPRHLIGKTLYLAGRQMKENVLLSNTFQLLGLGMYEKWTTALEFINSLEKSEGPILLSEGVEEFKKYMSSIPNEDMKTQFEDLLTKLQNNQKIQLGDLDQHLNLRIPELLSLEKQDIQMQMELFDRWEQDRQLAAQKQHLILDKKRRLEEIAKKKEYLYWKEKLLFFYENEESVMEEFKKAEEITAEVKKTKKEEEIYVIPEVKKEATKPKTKYEKLARVKKL